MLDNFIVSYRIQTSIYQIFLNFVDVAKVNAWEVYRNSVNSNTNFTRFSTIITYCIVKNTLLIWQQRRYLELSNEIPEFRTSFNFLNSVFWKNFDRSNHMTKRKMMLCNPCQIVIVCNKCTVSLHTKYFQLVN